MTQVLARGKLAEIGIADAVRRMFRQRTAQRAEGIIQDQKDLSNYNKFVRDAVLGKLINPKIVEQ